MGKGIIKANNGNGSYDIEIVFDRTRIDAELAKLAENRQILEDKLYTGTPEQDDILNLQIAAIDKRVAYINEHAPQNVTWTATCVDYTDDLAIDAVVGTIEIARRFTQVWKGTEPEVPYLYTAGYWIRPGFSGDAGWSAARDGILSPTINQSPATLYYNLAMLPGAQKWRPRYRRGIITDKSGDSCDVTLTDLVYLTEEKAEIDIDQDLSLTSVPIEYMDCNGDAFEIDDPVIVEFTDQEWSSPKVIGFYDEPQPCGIFYYSILFSWYGSADLDTDWYDHLYFKLDPEGNFSWLTDEQVDALSINTDDWFTKTYQRSFLPTPSKTDYAFSGESYRAGNPQPSPWGDFENLYASGWQYYAPGGTNFFYLAGDMKIHLFQSSSAVGIATSKFTKTWLTSNLRKIETVTELVHTPGRWDGFQILGSVLRPGLFVYQIATYDADGFILVGDEIVDIREYMTGVPGYYFTIVRTEACVVETTRTIYDSISYPTKAGYGEGVEPTIDNFMSYMLPEVAAAILNGYPDTPYMPEKYWSADDIQVLDDNGIQMDYYKYTYYDGTNSTPTIRISPRTCGGNKMYLAPYTGQGIDGYGDEVLEGPWWIYPRDDYQWVDPWNASGETGVYDPADYPLVGENWWSTENDKRGTNNWYTKFSQTNAAEDKIYEFFYREISNQYRFVINYKYFGNEKSIVLVTEKNGEYVSELTADAYQTFSSGDGDAMLYKRDATRIITNDYIAATPPHFAPNWSDFYNSKLAEYSAQGKTVDFVSSINPLLN